MDSSVPILPNGPVVRRTRRANLWVYLAATFIWIGICIYLEAKLNVFVVLPPVIFALNWYLSPIENDNLEAEAEGQLSSTGLISFAVLITAVMFNWKKDIVDKSRFLEPMSIAFFLMLLSLVDISVDARYAKYLRQLSGAFQTMAVTLVGYALYEYYRASPTSDPDISKVSLG